ncbi:hypothetical protein PGT21_027902 [Puccinia graminis f. sp. tritici]|uniref:Uncharacterized protein n=1 Tax=Puccinia graminis f. sp. tritici TaxID=56615 RepID=A0A5B0NRR6_PUCGR|nr:hypothetical protein PGTUg99_019535 [Puccinia graminis f. sp. tritici]KAA1091184.1 hypothetical protein PGT21_027902 [Puccinia graminis f. sp. tritici]
MQTRKKTAELERFSKLSIVSESNGDMVATDVAIEVDDLDDPLLEGIRRLQSPPMNKSDNPAATATSQAGMELGGSSQESLATINAIDKACEIHVLTHDERIKNLVHEHIAIWRKCNTYQSQLGPSKELRGLLGQAQQSQRFLEKLIPKSEIEGYVHGWNPWTIERELFPRSPKRKKGKKGKNKSSTSQLMKFDDPQRWAKVFEIGRALIKAYDDAPSNKSS